MARYIMLISFRNLKLIAEVGMMKHGILLLASEDTAVVKQCHKTLLSLAAYDEGVIILYRYYLTTTYCTGTSKPQNYTHMP